MADNGTQAAIAETIQSRVRDTENIGGLDILPLLIKAGEIMPAWWSRKRDIELSMFWKKSDHISGAISMFQTKTASVPLKVEPRDTSIKRWVKLADDFNELLIEGSNWGEGWAASLCLQIVEDYLTQDNGFFVEVIGPGKADGPIEGLPFGLAHLDAQRCQRTSSPEFPVIYTDTDGRRYKLHASRVMFAAGMKSARARMNGVGFCSLSRMIAIAQNLIDIATYEQEKLGSRPPRQAIIAESGITAEQVVNAFAMAEEGMNSKGFTRFSNTVVVGPKTGSTAQNPVKVNVLDLNSVPDGFNKQESVTLGMFMIALALNIPPRWIWPATQAGATKADAEFSHVAGMGGGIGHLLELLQKLIGGSEKGNITGKFLPPGLKLVFDFQDDEQDRAQGEIRKLRAEYREKELKAMIIDPRVARQQMLEDGDLTEAQFNDLELRDGRLPTGEDVLTLFYSADPEMQRLLSLSIGDPLNVEENIENLDFILGRIREQKIAAQVEIINIDRPNQRQNAEWAVAALSALERLYTEKHEADKQEEMFENELANNQPEGNQPEGEEQDNGASRPSQENQGGNGAGSGRPGNPRRQTAKPQQNPGRPGVGRPNR